MLTGFGGLDYFRGVFGGAEVVRENSSQASNVQSGRKITLRNGTFAYGEDNARFIILHEFGHLWDARTLLSLSKRLENETGGATYGSGCSNRTVELVGNHCSYSAGGSTVGGYASSDRREDFADSFAAYMFKNGTGDFSTIISGHNPHRIHPGDLTVSSADRFLFVHNSIQKQKEITDKFR